MGGEMSGTDTPVWTMDKKVAVASVAVADE